MEEKRKLLGIIGGLGPASSAYFYELITEHTKAILICNPNNPTGYLYSEEEMERLRQIILKYDLYLISDEVYREYMRRKEEGSLWV